MDQERHIAEGSRLIVLADQQHERSGLAGLERALGLDHAEGQAIAMFIFLVFSWLMMRLAKSFDKNNFGKSAPAPQRVGHSVAVATRKAPPAKVEHVRGKVARRTDPGRTMGTSQGVSAGGCSWRKVRASSEEAPALWVCGRCQATYSENGVPMTCKRAG